jgi:hypothetical protein
MSHPELPRREFLKMLAGTFSAAAIDWDSLPFNSGPRSSGTDHDAIVIGAGLAGLSCAAAFARQGFKPLVIEQHDKPGGYATAFHRPGGFLFDVSLHSTSVGERNGVYNLIQGFPEITDVEFHLHPSLFRSIFPEHDITGPAQSGRARSATDPVVPGGKDGIAGLFGDMKD